MVSAQDIFLQVPLASLVVWIGLGAWTWGKGLRTAPERAFATASLLVGIWALADWIFYQAPTADIALLAARVRMSILVLVSLAYFYFGRWLVRTRSIVDVLALLPVAGSLVVAWTLAAPGVQWSGIWSVIRDPLWTVVYQAQIGAYAATAIGHLAWSLRRSTFASESTRNKLTAVLGVLLLGLAFWAVTNVYSAATGGVSNPTLSPAALVLGLLLLLAVVRVDTHRFRTALRRLLVTPARPTIAILYHNSGQALAEVRLAGARDIDEAALSDVAQAVDHVLTTGLRSEAGSLRQMRHGDHHILFERGDFVTLVVVSLGPPAEGLRSEMRNGIRDLESTYREGLATWESAARISDKALAALDEVLRPSGI